jgi:glucose/arabinose dehydrogenase
MRDRRRRRMLAALTSLTVTALVALSQVPAEARPLPRNPALRRVTVKAVPVKTGMNSPSAFTFSPDGRIWFLEKDTGRLRVLRPSSGRIRTVTTISITAGTAGTERGALGVALHPAWPKKRFVYVYATRDLPGGGRQNQVVRLHLAGGHVTGRRILLRSPVDGSTNHNGGRILFGPDRKLYIEIGDGGSEYPKDPRHAQNLSEMRGKILRIRPDGTIPSTNPFGTAVWAFGVRNSFGFTFDPWTDRLWDTQNGPECNDEINLVKRGANLAWGPHQSCGSLPTPRDTNRDGPRPRTLPKYWFVTPIAITGAEFCHGCHLGAALRGDLLFGAASDGVVRALDLNAARNDVAGTARVVVDVPMDVHSMEVAPSGRIYVSGPTGIYRLAKG